MAFFFITPILLGALLIGSFFLWKKIVGSTTLNNRCDNDCEYCLNHQAEVEHTTL